MCTRLFFVSYIFNLSLLVFVKLYIHCTLFLFFYLSFLVQLTPLRFFFFQNKSTHEFIISLFQSTLNNSHFLFIVSLVQQKLVHSKLVFTKKKEINLLENFYLTVHANGKYKYFIPYTKKKKKIKIKDIFKFILPYVYARIYIYQIFFPFCCTKSFKMS